MESVAGPSPLPGRIRRCAHSRRSHRLTPPRERLRMVVAGFGAGLRPRGARGTLRRLRSGGGAGFAARSPDGKQRAGLGMGGDDNLTAIRLSVVPYGSATVAALEIPGVDFAGCGSR